MGELRHSAERMAADLERARRGSTLAEPFRFDSGEASISAYVEALELVGSRFWATSFLSSGFWTTGDIRIIDANAAMMDRLRRGGGDVRRLFLLDQPAARVLEAYREQRHLLEHLGKEEELARLDDGFERVKTSIHMLTEAGCATRFAYDDTGLHRQLPAAMSWSPADSELAIYDHRRVDIFAGGHDGRISGLTAFTPAMAAFEAGLAAAEEFFERMWECAAPHNDFVEGLDRTVESSRTRIRYRSNWLARYEHALEAEDEELKGLEAERAEQLLRDRGRWGRIGSYLDIGTCTGRYLSGLCDAVADDGRIVGIDDNLESVLFARAELRKRHPDDLRISVLLQEFGADRTRPEGAPFDLITCMMSTVSHFGWDRNDDFDDTLQRNLEGMVSLLTDEGMLLFSCWSPQALLDGNLLSIYHDSDVARLAEWTPPTEELARRLKRLGFRSFAHEQPDPRLDLWICER